MRVFRACLPFDSKQHKQIEEIELQQSLARDLPGIVSLLTLRDCCGHVHFLWLTNILLAYVPEGFPTIDGKCNWEAIFIGKEEK